MFFYEEEGYKTAVQSYHLYGHPLSEKLAICSCNISLILLSYQMNLLIQKYSGKASVLA